MPFWDKGTNDTFIWVYSISKIFFLFLEFRLTQFASNWLIQKEIVQWCSSLWFSQLNLGQACVLSVILSLSTNVLFFCTSNSVKVNFGMHLGFTRLDLCIKDNYWQSVFKHPCLMQKYEEISWDNNLSGNSWRCQCFVVWDQFSRANLLPVKHPPSSSLTCALSSPLTQCEKRKKLSRACSSET